MLVNNMTKNVFKNMEAMDIVIDIRGKSEDKYLLSHRGSINDKRAMLRYRMWRAVAADGSCGEWNQLEEMNAYQAFVEFDLEKKQEVLSYKVTPAWFVMLWRNNQTHSELIDELTNEYDDNSGNPVRFVIRINSPRVPSYSAGTVRKWVDENGQVWVQPVIAGTSIKIQEIHKEINYTVLDQVPVRAEDLIPHNQYFEHLNSVKVSDLREKMSGAVNFMKLAGSLEKAIKADNMIEAKPKPAETKVAETKAPTLSVRDRAKEILAKGKKQTAPDASMDEEPIDMEIF